MRADISRSYSYNEFNSVVNLVNFLNINCISTDDIVFLNYVYNKFVLVYISYDYQEV